MFMLIYLLFLFFCSSTPPPTPQTRTPPDVADVAQNMFQMPRVRHGAKYENLQRIQQITILRGVSKTPQKNTSAAHAFNIYI